MDVYDRITQKLKESNITRKELSEMIGVSYHTLNGLFKRKSKRLSIDILQSISKVLNVTSHYLAFGEEKNEFLIKDELMLVFESLSFEKQNELLKYAKYLKNN